jgi:peptide chain release factor 3
VDAAYEPVPIETARWISSDEALELASFKNDYRPHLALDAEKTLVYLAPNPWKLEAAMERYPRVRFLNIREIGQGQAG